jgi:hypothetical protein
VAAARTRPSTPDAQRRGTRQPEGRGGAPPRLAGRAWLWSSFALTAGALAVAIALAPPAGAKPVRALAWLLFTGSSVHVASTGWLLTVPEVRAYAAEHPIRCRWVPLALVAGAALAAAVITPASFQWMLLPYFCWQFFHYQKQNVGMAALAASVLRVRPLSTAERWPLQLAGWSAVAALTAAPGLLGLTLFGAGTAGQADLDLRRLAAAMSPIAAASFGLCVVAGLAAIARRPRSERPCGFCATYATSLLFCLPVFVFASPYAAVGGMTIAHGLQYLLLVVLIAGGGTRPARPVKLATLANIALIGGAALSAASHLHDASPAARLLFGAYLGVVMAHFVIDAGLWRMRDPLARRFLASQLPYLVPGPPRAEGRAAGSLADRSLSDIECAP